MRIASINNAVKSSKPFYILCHKSFRTGELTLRFPNMTPLQLNEISQFLLAVQYQIITTTSIIS